MTKSFNENIIQQLNWRYSTKKFDINKKISASNWQTLEETLSLSPSSYGLQPFQFLIVLNPEIRKKLTPASFGQAQIETCSHLVVVTHLKTINEEQISNYIHTISEVRGVPESSLNDYKKMMVGDLLNPSRFTSIPTWSSRQAYIAMGAFMTAASLLQIDVCPMEGFEPEKYTEILGLKNSQYTPITLLAAGYRAEDDQYQYAKKVRKNLKELIKII